MSYAILYGEFLPAPILPHQFLPPYPFRVQFVRQIYRVGVFFADAFITMHDSGRNDYHRWIIHQPPFLCVRHSFRLPPSCPKDTTRNFPGRQKQNSLIGGYVHAVRGHTRFCHAT